MLHFRLGVSALVLRTISAGLGVCAGLLVLTLLVGAQESKTPPCPAKDAGQKLGTPSPSKTLSSGCSEITFNRDIAPIIFRSCATCHRPGEAAPFSLLAYG